MEKVKNVLKPYYHLLIRLSKWRRRLGLKCKDFSIISNSCAAGFVYQYFGIKYLTPTAGIGIHPDDYLKLMQNPLSYFTEKLCFVEPNTTERWNLGEHFSYPVAKIGDGDESITVYFRHYKTRQEAQHVWEKRCKRINYSKLFFLCTENEYFNVEHIKKFCEILDNTGASGICLTRRDYSLPHTQFVSYVGIEDGKVMWYPNVVIEPINWKKTLNNL